MANTTISNLPSATSITTADVFPIVQGAVTKKAIVPYNFLLTGGSVRTGVNVAANALNIWRLEVDNAVDAGITRAVRIERTASADEGGSDVYSAMRVYSNVTATNPTQSEWVINGVGDSYSNNTSNSGVTVISGTANKYGDAGGLAGHFNALDMRTYNNSVDVTRNTGVELDINGLGRDSPTANSGTGSRRGIRIQPRSVQTVAPTWGVWAPVTLYAQYDVRVPIGTVLTAGYTGFWYEATTGGTSAAVEPVWPTTVGSTIVDGSVTWTCRKGFEAGIGLHITTNASFLGYFRYGAVIEEATGDPNVIDVAMLIQTGGTTGIQITKAHSGSDILCSVNSGYGITLSGTYTNAALRVGNDQYIQLESSTSSKFRFVTTTDMLEFANDGSVRLAFELDASARMLLNGTQVVQGRVTGFTTSAGTANKNASGINVDTITATDANIRAIGAWLKAVNDACITHGLIGT